METAAVSGYERHIFAIAGERFSSVRTREFPVTVEIIKTHIASGEDCKYIRVNLPRDVDPALSAGMIARSWTRLSSRFKHRFSRVLPEAECVPTQEQIQENILIHQRMLADRDNPE